MRRIPGAGPRLQPPWTWLAAQAQTGATTPQDESRRCVAVLTIDVAHHPKRSKTGPQKGLIRIINNRRQGWWHALSTASAPRE